MVSSWDKMVLNHVNRDVTVYQNGVLVAKDARCVNIDLIGERIILRKDKGEGAQITVWGGSIIIYDSENYRPGQSEYESKYGIPNGRSPEELIRGY